MRETKYTLSICLVTMNRAAQLREALQSCLFCELPKETEFVIIDNASTDNTEEIVKATLQESGYAYYYEKLPGNLGVGGGRNYAYAKANGEFVYMLDDDAVIDFESTPDFFLRAVSMMEENPAIVTLTTQIYDTAWQENRLQIKGTPVAKDLYSCQMFCGGSHFLKTSFFEEPPYLSNKYGYEELPPSLRVMDAGRQNAFCPTLLIIHKPTINKWDWNDEKNHGLLIKGIATPYALKRMMYPRVFAPLLWLTMRLRAKKHAGGILHAKKRIQKEAKEIFKGYPAQRRIKFLTVCRMAKEFKLSAF